MKTYISNLKRIFENNYKRTFDLCKKVNEGELIISDDRNEQLEKYLFKLAETSDLLDEVIDVLQNIREET